MMDRDNKTVLLCAGGTGGHLFPAQALAGELLRRGYVVDLATDERADKYGAEFPARNVHLIASGTMKGRSPLALAKAMLKLGYGVGQSWRIIGRMKPSAVVGFGGYPTIPPMFGALLRSVPTILHESNAVMGRANRMLAGRASAIATNFPLTNATEAIRSKLVATGNPVRGAVLEAANTPYVPPAADEPFDLLVFGGSQGATVFSEVLPAALALVPAEARARLRVTQQCRPTDLDDVRAAYEKMGVQAELAPFFKDMPARIAKSHLVVCRSGASTVSELSAIGRPSLLVPLPGALDNDQGMNAKVLEELGGAWPVEQKDFTADYLAGFLANVMGTPQTLAQAAEAARRVGKPDAVERLADLVEHIAAGAPLSQFVTGEAP